MICNCSIRKNLQIRCSPAGVDFIYLLFYKKGKGGRSFSAQFDYRTSFERIISGVQIIPARGAAAQNERLTLRNKERAYSVVQNFGHGLSAHQTRDRGLHNNY